MKYKGILLFGAPGSGKGTQGKVIGAIPGFIHCSTGDLFRSLDPNSEMGRLFHQYADRGELVPDEFTIRLWKQYIQNMERLERFRPATDLLVLDGIPRSLQQAALLDREVEVLSVIHLDCQNMDKMVERLRGRAIKENRPDDADEKVIRHRLQVYATDTRPVLDYYPPHKIASVEATRSMIRVLSEIVSLLVPLKESREAQGGEPFPI